MTLLVERVATPRPRWAPRPTLLTILAETLLVGGALVGLYVVWLLWWTDVVGTAQAKAAVVAVDAQPGWEHAPSNVVATPATGDPPHDAAFDDPAPGQLLAVLHVPRWGADFARAVYEGVTKKVTLDPLGIGHYPGTAGVGDLGNFAMAGHRTTFSKPFNRIAELQVGDPIVVETADTWYVYTVSETNLVVLPKDVEVLAPVPGDDTWSRIPTQRSMTMTACHPMFSASHRYVVHAVLSGWMAKSTGTPAELLGGASAWPIGGAQ